MVSRRRNARGFGYSLRHSVNITVLCGKQIIRTKVSRKIHDVTLARSDIQHRNINVHDVVDLRRMNNADKLLSQNYNV